MQKTWPGIRSTAGLPGQLCARTEQGLFLPPHWRQQPVCQGGRTGSWVGMLLPCRACPKLFLWAKVWKENGLSGSSLW